MLQVLWCYHGTWYKWGGDDSSGFDCSGLVIEALKSIGLFPRKEDTTADGLRLLCTIPVGYRYELTCTIEFNGMATDRNASAGVEVRWW